MTMSTKEEAHTAGPWQSREDRTVAANGVPLLRCYTGRNAEANARLIAAAPELLAAGEAILNYARLDEILSDKSRHDDSVFGIRLADLRAIRAAIARATGAAK